MEFVHLMQLFPQSDKVANQCPILSAHILVSTASKSAQSRLLISQSSLFIAKPYLDKPLTTSTRFAPTQLSPGVMFAIQIAKSLHAVDFLLFFNSILLGWSIFAFWLERKIQQS
jgi:hypothetical protein